MWQGEDKTKIEFTVSMRPYNIISLDNDEDISWESIRTYKEKRWWESITPLSMLQLLFPTHKVHTYTASIAQEQGLLPVLAADQ
jgi:hypothetical protein